MVPMYRDIAMDRCFRNLDYFHSTVREIWLETAESADPNHAATFTGRPFTAFHGPPAIELSAINPVPRPSRRTMRLMRKRQRRRSNLHSRHPQQRLKLHLVYDQIIPCRILVPYRRPKGTLEAEGSHWLPWRRKPRLGCWSWRRLRRSVGRILRGASRSRRSAGSG